MDKKTQLKIARKAAKLAIKQARKNKQAMQAQFSTQNVAA